jgi:hypothetical protein
MKILPQISEPEQRTAALPSSIDNLFVKRLATNVAIKSRSVESWAELVLRRVDSLKPLSCETFEVIARITDLAREIPRANAANIRMALDTLLQLSELEMRDAQAGKAALENMLHALKRAEALSGVDNMTVADAENYLRELARGGNLEAQKLLPAFDDPFADL